MTNIAEKVAERIEYTFGCINWHTEDFDATVSEIAAIIEEEFAAERAAWEQEKHREIDEACFAALQEADKKRVALEQEKAELQRQLENSTSLSENLAPYFAAWEQEKAELQRETERLQLACNEYHRRIAEEKEKRVRQSAAWEQREKQYRSELEKIRRFLNLQKSPSDFDKTVIAMCDDALKTTGETK